MNTLIFRLTIVGVLLVFGCSVMPTAIQREALPQMPFSDLVRQADNYIGQTVVLGGYVVAVENQKDQTRLIAVQAPLGTGQEPKSKDLSQGRLIVIYQGFLDPEVYGKGRKITIAGELLGSSATESKPEPYPFVRIQISAIHLWPLDKPKPPDPFWDYPWHHYPYPYPFWWRHPRYWD